MEIPVRDKHSSLLRTFTNYGRKKFNNIGPWALNPLHPKLIFVIKAAALPSETPLKCPSQEKAPSLTHKQYTTG